MKRHIIGSLLSIAPALLPAQVSTENYVKSTQMLDGGNALTTIQYYDGYGRPFEKVAVGVTPTGGNLVYLTEYDGLGRESRQWLPAVTSQAFLAPAAVAVAAASCHGEDTHAYRSNHYDGSPLNRIVAQDLEGAEWVGHPATTEYLTNTQQMPLSCTDYSAASNSLHAGGLYASGTLRVVKSTDVSGNVSYVFKDLQDRKVLERRMDGSTAHDTYYVYDSRGDLRYVLQPMYQQEASLEKYAFCYKYDDRHNVVEKQLPGCDAVRYAYDRANRLVLSQDGRQRSSGKSTFMLYDKHDRVVLKGECNCPSLPDLRSATLTVAFSDSQGSICSTGYTDSSGFLYTREPRAEAAYYYDNYSFAKSGIFTMPGMASASGNAQGLMTGEITSFSDGTPKTAVIYRYDEKGRQVKSTMANIRNGLETFTTTYSLTDKPLRTTHTFSLSGAIPSETCTYSYDHADRLVSVTHQLSGHPSVTLAENTYDGLCRLSSKNVMGERISYQYNVRDWLTSIAASHFAQSMTYSLDGNIKTTRWSHSSDNTPMTYDFSYDGLGRLKQASYSASGKDHAFSTRYDYDLNGNITELSRNAVCVNGGSAVMDNLVMSYNGNQLLQVDNGSDDEELVHGVRYSGGNLLTYDKNGCLTSDKDKDISPIQYNSLNLPTSMKIGKKVTVTYQYDSKGNKLEELRKVQRAAALRHQTQYCGNYIFENGVLRRILVEGGFIYFGENDTTYHYFLKDHLGSNRAVVNAKTGQVVEQYDYYPFGKQHGDYHTGYIHPYRYNGKELDEIGGLDWLHYGARMMEPAWGRFTTPDPLAEKYYDVSPYAYCHDNPINKIDIKGMWDIRISASPNRGKSPYAKMVVTDNSGNKIFSTVVRVSGEHRNRGVKNGDTPQGSYRIKGWRKTGNGTRYNAVSYGENDLLALEYQGGDDEEGKARAGMHLHGGRPRKDRLVSTHGCIRISDNDIAELKRITDSLTSENPEDTPNELIVIDELDEPVNWEEREKIYDTVRYGGTIEEIIVTPQNEEKDENTNM